MISANFCHVTDYPKEINYMYAIPLKQFYNESMKLESKTSISRYQIPHSKNISLFCTSPLSDQFLRLAVAVKNKVYMLAYKHPATMVLEGSPVTPISTDPKENFIKHRVCLTNPLYLPLLSSFFPSTLNFLHLTLTQLSSAIPLNSPLPFHLSYFDLHLLVVTSLSLSLPLSSLRSWYFLMSQLT